MPISAITIQDTIKAGRIVEARTLLTLESGPLSETERSALDLELTRLHSEAAALVAQAEVMETDGRTEEAKALYESVLLFAVDFPGIQSHIKEMEESLFLTKAVKRRSQRIRESTPIAPPSPPTRKSSPLLATGLATAIVAVFLGLLFLKNQPQQTIPPKARQDDPVRIAQVHPVASLETTASSVPAATAIEKPVSAEPVQPETKEPQTASPLPIQPENTLTKTAEPPPVEEQKVQKNTRLYTVQPGDSLSLIAVRQFCNRDGWEKIYQLNKDRIIDPDKVQPGLELQLQGIENRCRPAR